MHWPVALNDVEAFSIGITLTQCLIKGDQETDGYLVGPAMENLPGVRIQHPKDTGHGHGVGVRAAHGLGLYRSALGCIGDGRLPFYADFVQVNGDDPSQQGLCGRYRRRDIGQFSGVVGIGTADGSPRSLPDDSGAPENGLYPRWR